MRPRYLGWKPYNWPAAVLVGGWVALFFVHLDLSQFWFSTFVRALPDEPIVWWPEGSLIGLGLTIAPLGLGLLATWLMPRLDWSVWAGSLLVAFGVFLFAAGVAWDAGSGVALYPDRIVRRDAGFGRPFESDRFFRVWRVETSCLRGRRGRPEPSYVLWFADGRSVDIWADSGIFTNRQRQVSVFEAVRHVDAAVNRFGVVRAPQRGVDGATIGSGECVSRLAKRLGRPREDVGSLFKVHQTQLRPDEYRVVPAP